MTRVIVEAGFGFTLYDFLTVDGLWTDITEYVDIITSGISITRGAENEQSQTQTGTCTLVLDNSDGRFTPEHTGSAYYPNVIDAVPLRVSVATVIKNYIRNTSFESDLEGGGLDTWEWSTGVEPETVATEAFSGTRSAKVPWNASAGDYFRTHVYGLTIGGEYVASAYVWVPAGDVAVRLRAAGSELSAATSTTGAWQRLTVTFTATSAVAEIQVMPSTTPAAGDFVYVDAVQVEDGTVATAFDTAGAELHERFFGLVNQWPVTWSGMYAKATIAATDTFAVLSRAEDQMRPMLVQEALLWGPNALYTMDEDSTATSSGNEAGVAGPMSLDIVQAGVGGTLEFGAGTAPLGMSGAPLFTPASASAGKYLRAELGSGFQAVSFTEQLLMEVWFSTSTAGRNIVSVSSPDRSYYLILYLASATGFLTVESKRPESAVTTTTVGATNLADGVLHHVIFDAEAEELYVDGVSIGVFAAILAVEDLSTLTVGASPGGGNLWAGSISNVALYLDTGMAAGNLAGHYECGTTGFAGETADERAFRLATYAGIGFNDLGTFSTGIAEQAALGKTCLDHLRDVEGTESGKLIARRDSPAVTLQGRSIRYNPVSALSILYADFEPDDFTLAYDTQKVANQLVLTRPGGATQRMVHAVSKAARGPIGRTVDTLCTTDLVVTDLGNWLLQRYSSPSSELRGIHIEALTMGTAVYRTLLDADVSTVVTVTTLPDEAPASSMAVTVEGYKESIRWQQHDLQFHTSRTETAAVWILDDSVYSVLGSTTRLAY